MKCSECTRRNSDENQFCIYCGTALTAQATTAAVKSEKRKKVVLPPQDIDELISDRGHAMALQHHPTGVHPAAIIGMTIVVGLAGVYYWFFYKDLYKVTAIDYATTNLIDE